MWILPGATARDMSSTLGSLGLQSETSDFLWKLWTCTHFLVARTHARATSSQIRLIRTDFRWVNLLASSSANCAHQWIFYRTLLSSIRGAVSRWILEAMSKGALDLGHHMASWTGLFWVNLAMTIFPWTSLDFFYIGMNNLHGIFIYFHGIFHSHDYQILLTRGWLVKHPATSL